jgi:hypothetical protein
MRAREFTINVPITIKINGDNDPEIDAGQDTEPTRLKAVAPIARRKPAITANTVDSEPRMVPPLQQDIELKKAAVGKVSPVIDDLTQDEQDEEDNNDYR